MFVQVMGAVLQPTSWFYPSLSCRAWDVSQGLLTEPLWKQPIVTESQWGSVLPPLITALDLRPPKVTDQVRAQGQQRPVSLDYDVCIAGTARGDIWEIDA